MFKSIILFLVAFLYLHADGIKEYNITPSHTNQNIHIAILDTKELNFTGVHELSALAYKKNMLYALSDQGVLYLFRIKITANKIEYLKLSKRYILKNSKNRAFSRNKRDAEGMCWYKKGLIISFEHKNRVLYCSREGKKISKMRLNALLEDNKNYVSPNKGLESVAYSQKYGLVTIPELPLQHKNKQYHTLYTKDRIWKFYAEGAVTDITFVDQDRVLILLREYSYITQHRVTSLVELNLASCKENELCKSKLIARLDSYKGWKIDNFEGITKVGKNRFLMVSDDNESFFQKTLLVLFEIKN